MQETLALDPIHACKRLFVQRQAVKKYPDPAGFDGPALRAALEARIGAPLTEKAFATHVAAWENDPEALDEALRYAAWATLTPEGQAAITAARCSTCLAGSIRSTSCRSRRSSATASPCCVCPSMTGATARASP